MFCTFKSKKQGTTNTIQEINMYLFLKNNHKTLFCTKLNYFL